MNTVLSRLNAVFAFFVSVMAVVTFMLFMSTFFHKYENNVTISTAKVALRQIGDVTKEHKHKDLGVISLNIQANLTNLFDWNVKQLFLYLTAEYKTKENELNQVVLWDKIVQRDDNYILNLSRIPTKYYFWDDGTGLLNNKNITLSLCYNLIPNTGLLTNHFSNGQFLFQFPDSYKF